MDPKRDLEDGILLERCGLGCVPFLEGKNQLTHHPKVEAVLESPKLRTFFEEYLFGGQDALTFDFKWLRVMPNDKFTGTTSNSHLISRYVTSANGSKSF